MSEPTYSEQMQEELEPITNKEDGPMNKRNPVKKNMDKLHKPKTHTDKTKYKRVNNDWSYDANGTPITNEEK